MDEAFTSSGCTSNEITILDPKQPIIKNEKHPQGYKKDTLKKARKMMHKIEFNILDRLNLYE